MMTVMQRQPYSQRPPPSLLGLIAGAHYTRHRGYRPQTVRRQLAKLGRHNLAVQDLQRLGWPAETPSWTLRPRISA